MDHLQLLTHIGTEKNGICRCIDCMIVMYKYIKFYINCHIITNEYRGFLPAKPETRDQLLYSSNHCPITKPFCIVML